LLPAWRRVAAPQVETPQIETPQIETPRVETAPVGAPLLPAPERQALPDRRAGPPPGRSPRAAFRHRQPHSTAGRA
jgi:hypothetical protein